MVTVAVPLVAAVLPPISFSHVIRSRGSYPRLMVKPLPYAAFCKAPNAVYCDDEDEQVVDGEVGSEKSVEGWVASPQLLVRLTKFGAPS